MRRLAPFVLALLTLAPLAAPPAAAQDADLFAVRKNFGLFAELYATLAGEYVDPVDAEALMRTGLSAMLGELDPYTVFFDEAVTTDGRLSQSGEVGGAGLAVAMRGGALVVTGLQENGPAERQGVRVGDRIMQIAGREADGLNDEAARELLRGEPGSTLELAVEREGEGGALQFVLVRAEAESHDVTAITTLADGIGYIRLEQFLYESAAEVRGGIDSLRQSGEMDALVLDLRGNPGGLLEQAVEIVGLFVPRGTPVVSTRGRSAGTVQGYTTRDEPLAPDLRVAVLVDGRSASASEIVAGAMQDHDRGVVVGETTFGKGLVQIVRPMPYGTALKLTVSRYYTPSGRSIQSVDYQQGLDARDVAERPTFTTTAGRTVRGGGGIEPDEAVGLGEESDLEAALVRVGAFLRFANRYRAETPTLPAGFAIDDELLRDFRRFAEGEGLDYRTAAEREADALAEALAEAGYGGADDELADLRAAVEREKAQDFERHAPRLRARLRQEILSRYLAQGDLARRLLDGDPVVERALEVLGDERRYRRLLGD
ncbi:MAG TPA: S41 family peptidase [Bacteroidetes bacterium]|nr:S41 family peptidase [Bacteroidota bacterium]HIL58067.1 S41 family peptidase [Rhodothermales bacterium]